MEKKKKKPLPEFRLDCTAATSKMPNYNGLRDANLASFFSSRKRRKQLLSLGLINKQGVIMEKTKDFHLQVSPDRPLISNRQGASANYSRRSNKESQVKAVTKDDFKALLAKTRKERLKEPPKE